MNYLILFALNVIGLSFCALAQNYLPPSPYQYIINYMQNTALGEYLGYINYFLPIGEMITELEVWSVAIFELWFYKLIKNTISNLGGIDND